MHYLILKVRIIFLEIIFVMHWTEHYLILCFLFFSASNLVRTLEKAKATGNFAAETSEVSLVNSKADSGYPRESESDTSDSEQARTMRRPKKLKVSNTGLH